MTTRFFPQFILLVLMSQVNADLNIGLADSGIDPGRITWWRSKWSPIAIELSKINERATGVEVKVRWRSTYDIEDCLLEVELPSSFILSDSGKKLTKNLGPIAGGVDQFTTMTQTVTNPATGVYGPVKIRTRHFVSNGSTGWTGQIVDANENFSMLYISPAENTYTTGLTVAILESYPKVGDKGKTLRVQFKLASDLWKYDLVKLTTDSHFTLASSVTCSSYKETGQISYFNGTTTASPLSVKCASSVSSSNAESDILYVYGLGNDIDTSIETANSVEIRVSSVTLPDRKYTTFLWKLEILSYTNRWVYQSGTYTAGPTINSGAIVSASWTPTWSQITKDKILPKMQIYINVSITTVNPIPELGTLVFEFSEPIDKTKYRGNTATGCYINNNIAGFKCDVNALGTQVTMEGFKDTPSTTFVITVMAVFNSDTRASITSITTKDSNGLVIDTASNAGLSMIGSTSSYTLLNFNTDVIGLSLTCGTNTIESCNKILPSTQHLWWKMGVLGQTTYIRSGVKFTIYLPFVTTSDAAAQEKAFYINNDTNLQSRYVGHSDVAIAETSGIDNIGYKKVTPVITPSSGRDSGNITWTFDTTFSTYSSIVQKTTVYFSLSRSSGDVMTIPYVAENAETRYQTAVEIKDTNTIPSFNPYVATIQFPITAMAWSTATFVPFSTANLAGLPATASVLPISGIPFPLYGSSYTGRTYYIEVELTNYNTSKNRMGSGLQEGDTFPCVPKSGTVKLSSITCDIVQEDTKVLIRMKGFQQLTSADSGINWFFTLGSQATPISETPKIRGVVYEDNDLKKVKNIIYEKSATAYTPVVATSTVVHTITYSSITAGDVILDTRNLGAHALLGTGNTDTLVYIFPAGYTIDSTIAAMTLAKTGATSKMTNIMSFSAKGLGWATLVGDESTASDIISSSTTFTLMNINGVKVVEYKKTDNVIRVLSKYGYSAAAASIYSATAVFEVSAGLFTNISVSPTTIKGKGPGSTKTDVTVTFTNKNPIPQGGIIVIKMNEKWTYISQELNGRCVFSGLTDKSDSEPVQCSYSDLKWTISNFSALSALKPITVIFYNLIPPIYEGSSKLRFVSEIASYKESTLTTQIDYTSPYNTANEVSVTSNTATVGSSNIYVKQTIPMNAGLSKVVDLYLKFSFQYSIPKGGYFQLTLTGLAWAYSDTDIHKKCWMNGVKYAACEYSSSKVKITLGEDYELGNSLELYLDDAFINPSTTTTINDAFKFSAYYGSLAIIEDYTGSSYAAHEKILELRKGSITQLGDIIGEYGDYTFTFGSPAKFEVSDQIWIVFPSEFDYFVGDANALYSDESSTYYLDCSSSLGKTQCTVDHNIVVITGDEEIELDTIITITIQNVLNPYILKGSTSSQFQVYHYNTVDSVARAGLQEFGTIITSEAISNNVRIKSITVNSHSLFSTAIYEFAFYLSNTLTIQDKIYIKFPRQYQLEMSVKSSVTCSATIQKVDDTEKVWFKSSSCSVENNWVIIDLSEVDYLEFTGEEVLRLKLTNFVTPQWGYVRTEDLYIQDWEFDVKDSTTFGGYDYWTDKFIIYIYSGNSDNFISKSYPETYSGYLGFDDFGRKILVNAFEPKLEENAIKVYAGTQSEDIYITTEDESMPCAAKSIVYSYSIYHFNSDGSTSSNVILTSVSDKFKMYENAKSIVFRVSAPKSALKGLYYISWTKAETWQSGVAVDTYQPPVRTLVEVTSGIQYPFIIGELGSFYRGEVSSFIPITISNPPHSTVTLTIVVKTSTQSTKLIVSPSTLTFLPDINRRYITIEVSSEYSLSISTSEILTFSLSGTDADSYTISSSKTISVLSGPSQAGVISEWGIQDITQTSASFRPRCTQQGVIYVHLAALGSNIPTVDKLVTSVGDLPGNGSENTLTDLEIAEADNDQINNTDQNIGESWKDYKERLYKLHLEYVFITAFTVDSEGDVEPFNVEWLWAGTEYQITGYHVRGVNQSVAKTEVFKTQDANSSVSFKLRFTGNVPSDYSTTIKQAAAKSLGINPLRIQYVKKENISTRMLQSASSTSTELQYYLLQERNSATPTPKEIILTLPLYKSTIQADLKATGFRYTLTVISEPIELTGETPEWEIKPRLATVTSASVIVEFLADIAGYVTCIADEFKDTQPSADQIYNGLNAYNTEVKYARVATVIPSTISTLEITDLDEATTYHIWCVASDSLPIWPTLMSDSSIGSGTSSTGLTTTTEEYENLEETSNSSGFYMSYVLSLIILVIT